MLRVFCFVMGVGCLYTAWYLHRLQQAPPVNSATVQTYVQDCSQVVCNADGIAVNQ